MYTAPVDSQLGKNQDRKKLMQIQLKRIGEDCLQQFYSIIYSSYRKNFTPLLTESKEIMGYVESKFRPTDTIEKIHTTTDSNWGCTIRVG